MASNYDEDVYRNIPVLTESASESIKILHSCNNFVGDDKRLLSLFFLPEMSFCCL